jgi:hypothetical protein
LSTYGKAEEVKRGVDGNESDFGSAIVVRESVERLKDGSSGGGDHAYQEGGARRLGLSRRMEWERKKGKKTNQTWRPAPKRRWRRRSKEAGEVEPGECTARCSACKVANDPLPLKDWGKEEPRAHHVLSRGDELDDTAVELGPLPPIRRLVRLLVPVEELRDIIGEVAHRTLPSVAALDESDVGVNVGSASTASSDDGILDDGDFGLGSVRKVGRKERASERGWASVEIELKRERKRRKDAHLLPLEIDKA